MASSKVLSFPYILPFQGITSFKPTNLPCFKRISYSFVNYPIGTSIYVRVFVVKICDFITLFISIHTSSN